MLREQMGALGDRIAAAVQRELGKIEIPYAIYVFNEGRPADGVIVGNTSREIHRKLMLEMLEAVEPPQAPAVVGAPTVVWANDKDSFDIFIGRGRFRDLYGREFQESVFSHYPKQFAVTASGLADSVRALWAHRLAGTRRQIWHERLESLGAKRLGCVDIRDRIVGEALVELWKQFIAKGVT